MMKTLYDIGMFIPFLPLLITFLVPPFLYFLALLGITGLFGTGYLLSYYRRQYIIQKVKQEEADIAAYKIVANIAFLRKRYEEAARCWEKITQLSKEDAEAYYCWGCLLVLCADQCSDISIYKRGVDAFRQASLLAPEEAYIFREWGVACMQMARLTRNMDYYKECLANYEKAACLNSGDPELCDYWGMALYEVGMLTENPVFLEESVSMFKKTAFLAGDYESIYRKWGMAPMEYGRRTGELDRYKNEIEELFFKAEKQKAGAAAYKLALLNSLVNDPERAVYWLRKSLKGRKNKMLVKRLLENEDLDNIRHIPAFKKIAGKYD
ncbi:MAG: hypothetical protein LUE93_11260 [Bacteroides sp.]|nr:hypothetical protein [Bacteroides sp.]